jgi:hypothetical protein
MLRFKILASAVPLIVAGLFTGQHLLAGAHPCIAAADVSVELAQLPWQASRLVSFTSDPARATVRVQIVDDPSGADFAVVDGDITADADRCGGPGPTRFIGIREPAAASTVIYMTQDAKADYRIYVRSRTFTPQEAAALIVGAHVDPQDIATGSL